MYPEVECLDHMVALFFIFGGTTILFSIVLPFYLPFKSTQCFNISTSSLTLAEGFKLDLGLDH